MRRSEPLTLTEALVEASEHTRGGAERLRELAQANASSGGIVTLTFEEADQEAFLDLAWIEIDATRYLTSTDGPRTLRAVDAGC